ncbi:MAG: polysaccharide deacetylase family protein [Acidilobaceae archaeon]
MKRIATLTVDVEMDAPPYLNSWRGVEEGLPLLLDILKTLEVKATFFTLGLVAVKYPKMVSKIVEEGHELASHGWDHRRLDKLSYSEATENVRMSLRVLKDFGNVISFRAPNFKLPVALLKVLKEEGIEVDSSITLYKPPFYKEVKIEEGIVRVPTTHPSSVLRLPFFLLKLILPLPGSLIVLDLHPWELVEVRSLKRPDLTVGVGRRVANNVAQTLKYLRTLGYEIVTLSELASTKFGESGS